MKKQIFIDAGQGRHFINVMEEKEVEKLRRAITQIGPTERIRRDYIHLNDFLPPTTTDNNEIWLRKESIDVIIISPISNITVPSKNIVVPGMPGKAG